MFNTASAIFVLVGFMKFYRNRITTQIGQW